MLLDEDANVIFFYDANVSMVVYHDANVRLGACRDANVPLVHAMMRMPAWVCNECKCLIESMPRCECPYGACYDMNVHLWVCHDANVHVGMS